MKKSTNDKLYVLYLQRYHSAIAGMLGVGENDLALSTANDVLEGVDEKESRYRSFLYFKAVALDNKGLVLDAFPIFAKLYEESPYDPNYFQSFKVCLSSLNRYAVSLIEKNHTDEKILNLYNLLTQYHYASYQVCEAAAIIYGMRGERELAKQILAKRLALSPFDLTFIASAITIAKTIDDQNWLSELRLTLKAILKKYPFRYEVLEVESATFSRIEEKAA